MKCKGKPLGFDTIKETFSEPLQRSAPGGTYLPRKEAKVNKREGLFPTRKSQERRGKPSARAACLPGQRARLCQPFLQDSRESWLLYG